MTVSYSYTWEAGSDSDVNIGFTYTDPNGRKHPWSIPTGEINNCKDPVARAIAHEIHDQAGAATGTVTVAIA